MTFAIAVVLTILWLLGQITAVTMDGLIQVLGAASAVVLLRVRSGRRALCAGAGPG